MKLLDLVQGSEAWLDYRRGKVSGTMLGDLYSKRGGRKIGFYELIAERLAVEPDDENRMDRGLRLEDEAIVVFEDQMNLKVERTGVCVHDDYPEVINSPDGLIIEDGKYKKALEIKCLSSARHLQAVIENKVPDEFEAQKVQYFIVNPDLDTLYFMFYDPRILSVPTWVITVTREELGDLPDKYLQFQLEQLAEINEIVERIAF
jgi:putative phage-type endonuclease